MTAPRASKLKPDAPQRVVTLPAAWKTSMVLAVVTLGLFAPACWFDFVNYDDNLFVTKNPHVQGGFTWANIVWALTNHDVFLWHPLTWFSHLLDYQLYGLKPGGHHLTSILIHTANAVLLFLTLRRMTGAHWRSAMVAALFAWHPLHVESVTWVAERKDVLSCFFWLLAIWTYCRHAQLPGVRRLAWVGLWFLLGLLAKPMVVTLPCVLLLLDIWPLQRIKLKFSGGWRPGLPGPETKKIIWEKVPLFILAIVVSLITYRANEASGALIGADVLSPSHRTANALTSYACYLGQVFWPVNLAVFYPFPSGWPAWEVAGSALLLIGLTMLSLRGLQNHGYFATGWLWFLGTLFPVIGLVQNGAQSMADRYTYIPFTGIFLVLVWGSAALVERRPQFARMLQAAGGAALLACVILTSIQLQHWRNSAALFTHALQVTRNNFVAHDNLGADLEERGRVAEAIEHYRSALQISPGLVAVRRNLGNALFKQGDAVAGIACYQEALRIQPADPKTCTGLGALFAAQGRLDDAIAAYREALKHSPDYAMAHAALGKALSSQGKLAEAEAAFREAVRCQRDFPDAQAGLASALLNQGKTSEAATAYRTALKLDPNSAESHASLGMILAMNNSLDEAEAELRQALALKNSAMNHNNLANVLVMEKKFPEAIAHYKTASDLDPQWVNPMNNLAWLLAVQAGPTLRDGPRAVQLAQRACELSQNTQPILLNTLAAAYAEAGRFPEAVTAARKALELASAAGNTNMAKAFQGFIQRYENHQAYHENAP